jgi:Ca2+-binding RTX toxin-like protein
MVASVLKRGNVAIVSYATDPIGPDGDDILRFVILAPIGSGTQIFFSDRNWNGTAFPAAGSGDGTFTYTAGADLPAGTVITITSAQLQAAGMDLSNNGDTVYVYQGSNADTPTTFLYAIDFGDDNSVFEAGELTGTGLTAGVDAVAVAFDQASYAGQSTQIPQTQLSSISNTTHWHGHSGDDIGGTIYDDRADVTLSGPLNNPDMQLFGMMSGGGQSDAFIRMDNDEASNVATNLTRLFRDNPSFTHLTDLAFDIEDGFWFAVDNDGSSTTRLLKGNIADLVSGTSTPTITVLYDFPNDDDNNPVDDDSFIDGIEIDTVNNKIYFIQGDIINGHNLKSISYTGTGLTDYGAIQLAVEPTVGFFGGVFDFTLDVAHNTAYFTYVLVNSNPPPSAAINYIVKVNSLSNPAGGYSVVQINGSDDPDGAGGNPANHFPQVEGSLAGIDIDIANQRLYFVTQRLGATGTAGIFMLDLVSHNYVELWQQQSNNATNTLQPYPTTQMEYIEVDTIGGRYYVSTLNNTDTAVGHDGTATDEGGSRIFTGALATTAGQPAPTVFASVFENTANGAVLGMEIDYAPTLTLGSAGSTYTESTNLPASPAGPTMDVATTPVVNDADQAIIQGATAAISTGFVSGDQLTFTNSGGITGSYNATTGVVTFTGNASFAAYQTVLDSVRFTNAGDNPTDYGASTSRIISFTVTDGLLNSDPATATVLVVGINDAPVNTVGAAAAVSEDSSANTIAGVSVFDVDANPATQDIVVTLSVAHGTISVLTNVVGGIVAGDITAGANGSATITITATQNQINATLAAAGGLTYTPTAEYNGADALTVVTNDQGFNGNDPGLTGTGTSEQDSDNKVINITAVNDAPTVIDATQTAATILEDTPSAGGETVSSLFTGSFSDVLDQQQTGGNPTGSVANTLAGIAVVGGSTGANGSWEYFNGAAWVPIGAASTASAVLIGAATAIRFNPALNFNGSPPDLIVNLVDSSGAAITNGATVNLTGATGGITRYSTATVALSESVTAVNDAPTISFVGAPTPAGAETRANTTTAGDQVNAAVAGLAGGGHVVVFQSPDAGGFGVFMQRYDGNGAPLGIETRINTTTAGDQGSPSVTALNGGGYVVTWQSVGQDTSGSGIYMQRYDGSGVAQGVETRVNTTIAGDQQESSVSALADGGYVVVWMSPDVSGLGIFGQRYNAAGVPQGAEFAINNVTTGDQQLPAVVGLTGGGFAVTFFSANGDASGQGVLVRRFDAAGVAQGNAVLANTFITNDQSYPGIGATSDGGYVVAWESLNQDGSGYGVYAQRYNSSGATVGTEFRVNATIANSQEVPVVTGLDNGGFVVSWRSFSQDGSDYGIYAQRYDASGTAVGSETRVNTFTTGAQLNPAIDALTGGGFVVTWTSVGQDGNLGGIYEQRFADGFVATEQVAASLKGGITVADVDAAPAAILTATLGVGYGVLNVTAGGSGAIVVSGNGTNSVVVTGTLAQLNALLRTDATSTVTYTADTDSPPAGTTFTVTVNDGGSAGLDPGLTGDATSEQGTTSVPIQIIAVNDPVTGTAPATATLDEDATNVAIAGMSITDPDAISNFTGVYEVTLSSTNGTMTLTTLAGLTFTAGDGTADATMTFHGTLAAINTALATAGYTPTAHYNGSATITLNVTDTFGGTVATGTGAATNDSDVINVTVTAVNDPVSTNAPPTATISEDAVNAAITGLSISDVDATLAPSGVYEATLSSSNGTMTMTTLAGLTFTAGDGTSDTTMTFHGTLAAINAALATATYTPPANYNGPAQITLSATDTFGGIVATGTGVATNDSDVIDVTVTAVNDTPVVTLAATGSSTEQVAGTLDATATISDIDLDALNGGNGNYTGSAIVVGNGNALDPNDLFSVGSSGAFTVNGGNLEAGGLVFATVQGGSGALLVINFTSSGTTATTALVNAVAQAIQYTYTGDTPPATIDVFMKLADGAPGNAGQGSTAGHPPEGTDIITLTITNTPENQPPVVDLNGTDGGIDFASAYTEDGTAAVIADTDVSITDADVGDQVEGATITITDPVFGDQLTVEGTLPGSIVAVGEGTATISLSGTGTQAEYQQALTQIRYSTTGNNPTVGGTDLTRSITVTVDDGEDPSGVATTTVTVTGSNDPPAGTDATITLTEDTPRLLAQADFGFSDPDSADAFSSVTITGVTGGTLYYDADGTGGAGLPVAVGSFPQTYTAAELAAGNVSFQANTNLNGTGVASLTFQVTDNSGAINNTDPSGNTLTFDVTPINDQPNIPNSPTVTTDEQVAVTINAAITVSDVDLDARNGGAGDYSGTAFAINRSVSDAEDVFSFNTAGAQFTVSGSNLESGGNVIATLAQSGGILNINFVNNGTVPTTALVNDVLQHLQYTNTSNEPPASVTLIYIIDDGAPGGGQGALGAPFNNIDGGQVTININSINDAPSGADKLITIDEDVTQVLTTADFGFSDIDNDTFDSAVVVSVTGGTILVDDGNIVTPPVSLTSGTISAADIAAGYVSFQPTAHLNGSGAGTISFQVVDNGGTANNGQNTDQSANTITFDIDSVNDAPAGADKTVTGSEDDPLVFTAADFGFTDPADSNAFYAVRIMTFPANGTLYLDSDGPGGAAPIDLSTVGAGVYVSITDINDGDLYFQPDPDEYGNGYANFTFAVQDDGGITNGGQDTDQTPNTMTIDIAPDNLPPAVDLDGGTGGVNYTASYTEDAPGVAIGSGVTVTDPNSGTGDMIESATITLTDRVAGDSLTLTGALPGGFIAVTTLSAGAITIQITGTGTGAQYQALIESILYATTNQDPTVGGTDPARTITVTVNDGLVDSAVATTTVNITALDDAAVAQPDAYTITEQGAIVAGNLFADNGSGADSDPDGPPLAVSAVNGSSGNVGSQITLPSGALLTLTANGTFDYNPNGAFDVTPVPGTGASNTPASDSFTYTLAGGNTVTVTITITGIDTNDDIIGTAGADTLTADGGTDRLIGLAGNDTYHVNSAGDLVIEVAGQGNDLVYTNVSYALAAGSSVETLSTEALGSTDPINLTGNELGNTLFGNAGANVLIGGGGADYMVGDGGDDTYYVDMLTDVVVEAAGQGRDVVYASASYALAAGSSVEVLSTVALGETTAINLTGNELVNVLYGNAGANRLIGGGGADYMVGFGGDDDYYVDAAGDVVIEAAGQGRDVVYASVSYVLAAGTSIEVLSTVDLAGTTAINLTGNELSNTITGNAGANVLNGGGGVDYMAGLGGDDDYYVDNAGDVVAENAGGGRDVVYTSISYTLAAGSSVEILSTIALLATTPINLTGNELGNGLFGNAGANVLNGGGGADYLVGIGGADSYAFTTALGGGNVDTIIDYSGVGTDGDDRILLDDAVFTGMTLGALDPGAFVVGTAALDADDRIIYDTSTGALYFDADGSGAGAKVQFAILDGAPALTAGDFFVI